MQKMQENKAENTDVQDVVLKETIEDTNDNKIILLVPVEK